MTGTTPEHVRLRFSLASYRRRDSNPQVSDKETRPSTWRVCQFRHFCVVHRDGFEPSTSTMSLWRSSPELSV